MPLIIMTGIPCSGKTTRALEIKSHFENKGKDVHTVSENVILKASGKEKNALYADSAKEKQMRSVLKSEAQRFSKPKDDADLLIVKEATQLASMSCSVVIVGEDTDLMVLLLHYWDKEMDVSFLRPSKTLKGGKKYSQRLTNIADVVRQCGQLKDVILAVHALSGCDTASGFFGKGKKLFLRVFEKNGYFVNECSVFYDGTCKKEDLIASGNRILKLFTDAVQLDLLIILDYYKKDNVVIIDAGNYIKGYRYEMYCMSKASKSTQCTVHCEVPIETASQWNASREDDEKYSDEIFDALVQRYEAPDSRNRWDSPLFTLYPDTTIDEEAVYNVLFERAAPPPNQSTQNPPLSSTNFLYELDRVTQDIVSAILSAQKLGIEGEIRIPGYKDCVLEAGKSALTPSELARNRRQFLAYTKLHPSNDISKIPSLFIQYLNTSLK